MNYPIPICGECGLEIPPTDVTIGGICPACDDAINDAWIDDLAEELANDDDDRDRDEQSTLQQGD